jgi:hypothetical protein
LRADEKIRPGTISPAAQPRPLRREQPRLTRTIAADEIYDGILDAAGRSLLP